MPIGGFVPLYCEAGAVGSAGWFALRRRDTLVGANGGADCGAVVDDGATLRVDGTVEGVVPSLRFLVELSVVVLVPRGVVSDWFESMGN